MSQLYDFSVEKNFTKKYKETLKEHPAIREAYCMREMYPYIFNPIKKGDKFAGRITMSLAGFSPEPGGLGYYCDANAIREKLNTYEYEEKFRKEIEDLMTYWDTENTSAKVRAAYPEDVTEALPSDDWIHKSMAAAPLYRMAGSYMDYEKLLESGIPGMYDRIRARKEAALLRGEDTGLFEGMEMALDLLTDCCFYYYKQAQELMLEEHDADTIENLREIVFALRNITKQKPQTLREAMQLMWIYTLLSGSFNYGRVDVYLGDFLKKDLENHVITEEQAQELFNGLWQLMADRKTTWNGRVIVGGKGRRNEKNADKAAMMAMEATRNVKEAEPQLTLRIYDGMDEKLIEKALQVIGEGRTYPLLYNDDINIPAVQNAFQVDKKEAEDYVPFGCGEYILNHKSYGSPNGIINLLKVLELTLHNGKDGITGEQAGPKTGEFTEFESFDELWEAYAKQVQFFVDALAKHEVIEYQVTGEAAPFLYLSMLYDDCIERGKGIFSGGIRYLGGTIETYGNVNTADSLTAIKEAVYDKKLLSSEKLLRVLKADFHGYREEWELLKNLPKYGNDDELADEMAKRVHEHICNTVRDEIQKVDLHSYLAVIINNSANTTLGKVTAASADGRKAGLHMANANNPMGGNDRKGLTAMLNSLVKLRPDIHAGAVQNMKFSPELFKNNGAVVKTVLKSYFEDGGTQAMISVVNKADLEQAMVTPEKYSNLFVRVGGFSARFIELEKAVQMEILSRTCY